MTVTIRAIDALLGIAYSEYPWLSQNSRALLGIRYSGQKGNPRRVSAPNTATTDEAIVSALLGITYLGQKGNPSRVSAPNMATTDEAIVSVLLGIPFSGQKGNPSRASATDEAIVSVLL